MEISHEEIQKILPHRYPFLLLDRILEFTLNEKVVGLKNVTSVPVDDKSENRSA